ncbi:nuclear nucleic acid-binding protein C1D [Anthonomus grandis grandis]|uniref:nuclear nucleic acid-binding protein C1D n=1 Tax=Anthonomus grandis grandis TaxID=2921223 RepID=UPI0021658B3B|nr:nuclear nucleic acid-binding protein C1D [Anthonomus grandis grandis]
MELPDLEQDTAIKQKLTNLQDSLDKIQKITDIALEADTEKLTLKDKVYFNLFLGYALNTLYWMYLKTKGEDPNNHDVKNQLNRIKEYMVKAKQAHDRHTIRPVIDIDAAKRFIKHGIKHKIDHNTDDTPPNKRIVFDDE